MKKKKSGPSLTRKKKGRMQVVAIKNMVSFEKKNRARKRAETKDRMQFFSNLKGRIEKIILAPHKYQMVAP